MWLKKISFIDNQSSDLVRRFRAHEPQALADVYDSYGRVIYLLIVRIIQTPKESELLVQESFKRAWNRAEELTGDNCSIGPWLAAIARNCALEYRGLPAGLDTALFSTAREVSPGRKNLIEERFHELSQKQRDVIELAFYEGLSSKGIAERLNQPMGCVNGRVRSALSWLRGERSVDTMNASVCCTLSVRGSA